MTRFEPKNPDYRAVATATFDRQQAMRTLGISIARLEPGEVDLSMPYSVDWTQQNGFVHAGIMPGVPLHEQSERAMLWIREPFLLDPRWAWNAARALGVEPSPLPLPAVRASTILPFKPQPAMVKAAG